jgi:cholinesterase
MVVVCPILLDHRSSKHTNDAIQGFVVGSANNKAYNGALLADQHDVVVVGLNYRLGVLGFPGASVPNKNPGLLDQRAGVEWLRDNVEAFGGDPKRMIKFGQSAGRHISRS